MCVCAWSYFVSSLTLLQFIIAFFFLVVFIAVWFYACVKQTFLNIYGKSVRFFSLHLQLFCFSYFQASERFDLRMLFWLHMPNTLSGIHFACLPSEFIQCRGCIVNIYPMCAIGIDKVAIFDETVSAAAQTCTLYIVQTIDTHLI